MTWTRRPIHQDHEKFEANGHRLIPHHGSLFSRTGTTELADIVLLCEVDHDHELHGKARTLRLKDGRILGPDGWVRR